MFSVKHKQQTVHNVIRTGCTCKFLFIPVLGFWESPFPSLKEIQDLCGIQTLETYSTDTDLHEPCNLGSLNKSIMHKY